MGKYDKYLNEDDDGGENDWIFSYSDMVSLVLGFFIIMFSMSDLDEEKMKELAKAIKQEIVEDPEEQVEYQTISKVGMKNEDRQLRALQLLVSVLNIGQNMEEAVEKIEDAAEDASDTEAAKQQLMKNMAEDEKEAMATFLMRGNKKKDVVVEIVLPNNTLFKPGSEDLTEGSKKELTKLAKMISSIEELVTVEIVGHSDSTLPSPRAKFKTNWGLSAARAGSVAKHMIESGIDRDLVRSSGQADLEPLFPERDANGRLIRENAAKNRRVNIVVKRRNVESKGQEATQPEEAQP